MSREHFEVARRMTEAFLSGDADAALALMHPQVEFEAAARPDARVWRGREGVRRAIGEWVGTWEAYSLEIDGYRDAPGGRVLVLWTERGRGKGSGVPLEHSGGYLVDVRDGEVTRIVLYNDTEGALAAAGLRE
jgi:ketosteroid isomerase-like protein